jgi:hypothetical protein
VEAWIVVLSVVSIVLPLWGLFGLWRAARREAKELRNAPGASPSGIATMGEFDVLLPALKRATLARPRSAAWDFFFIGVGVVAGGVANILGAF